jgi:hypothetical protein
MALELARAARLIPGHSALHVPDLEACDVKLKLYSAFLGAEALQHHLSFCHGLPAAIAGFPVSRAAPHLRKVVVRKTSIGELCLDQKAKGQLVHIGDGECTTDVPYIWDFGPTLPLPGIV